MRLANLKEYRSLYFTPDSAPSMSTLRANIDKELIPGGCKRMGRYYVDLDEHDRVNAITGRVEKKRRELSGNSALAGLI